MLSSDLPDSARGNGGQREVSTAGKWGQSVIRDGIPIYVRGGKLATTARNTGIYIYMYIRARDTRGGPVDPRIATRV